MWAGTMKRSSVRLVVYVCLGLLALRVFWMMLTPNNTSLQEMDSIILNHRDPSIRNFKPTHCIVVDGKCIPQKDQGLTDSLKGLVAKNKRFYLDGQPITIMGGSMHYFRVHPHHWGDRLLKMKAAGLNVVTTYVPWNLHEQIKGQYNFTGLFDLPSFLQHVHRVGLKAIVRPGPYICSEWDFGGLPSWLLRDPHMRVRSSSYKPYLNHVKDYFSQLLPILARHQHKRNQGPIIAFQIENEFGSYRKDPDYLIFLKHQFELHGLEEMFMTSDGPRELPNGTLPDVFATVNFKNSPEEKLRQAREFRPNEPTLVMEYWAGWFDVWGLEHSVESPDNFADRVKFLLLNNASINFYMFEGGTSFGFWNGANVLKNHNNIYAPQVSSYDYDAPLSEAGDITTKYHKVRNMVIKLGINAPLDLPEVPQDTPKAAYGTFSVEKAMSYQSMISLIDPHNILYYENPRFMEFLDINSDCGQGYGWILYRHAGIPGNSQSLKIEGDMADRMQIIVNGLEEKVVEMNQKVRQFTLRGATRKQNVVDLLVENTGRVNFKQLDNQRKGLHGSVYVDGRKLVQWQHVPFEFPPPFVAALSREEKFWAPPEDIRAPAIYKVQFNLVGTPTDTFLDMRSWTKGIVIINKFNLGRYWNIGPAHTLYVPGPILVSGINEVFVFELHQAGKEIVFIDKPILG